MSKIDIERFRKFRVDTEDAQNRLAEHLAEMEDAGWRLTTLEFLPASCGEGLDPWGWTTAIVRDSRTGDVLGIYTREEFEKLDFGSQRWYDADHYYDE